MLLSHVDFLARVSGKAARRLIFDFRAVMDSIAENPFSFPFADEIDAAGIPINTYRKCFIKDRYKVLYIVENKAVYVDAIIDCRQENADLY
jgi:plasmid stabilization system protein ParE